MSALAAYLHMKGAHVTGSDQRESVFTSELIELGILVNIGHDADHVPSCDILVVTPAVNETNCELVKARKAGTEIIKRGKLLAEVLHDRRVIAVAGSHGKTSTCALLAWILQCAGMESSALVGGFMKNFNRNYVMNGDEWVVVEADESDGSMNFFVPEILVLLNVDDDHIDHYGNLDTMIQSYKTLAEKTKSTVILNAKDPVLQRIGNELGQKAVYFGDGTVYAVDESSIRHDGSHSLFTARSGESSSHEVTLSVPERFYINNLLPAMAVAMRIGVPFSAIQHAASTFQGVKRRGDIWGTVRGVTIMEDYAHHPTEIAALLESVARRHRGRIICIFQPHRYTRSKHIAPALADAFARADVLILTDIYSADEPPIPGVSGEFVYHEVLKKRQKPVQYVQDVKSINECLSGIVSSGDIVIFTGAGNVGLLASEFKEVLQSELIIN